jgi:hypothetical protein
MSKPKNSAKVLTTGNSDTTLEDILMELKLLNNNIETVLCELQMHSIQFEHITGEEIAKSDIENR